MLERMPAALLAVSTWTLVPSLSPTGYFAATSTPAITAASAQKIKPNGFTAGGQAGYNWQWGDVVFGLETDFGKMNLSGSTTATQTYPCCAPTAFTVTQTAKTSWVFTARPRVGVVFGMLSVYGTAGGAVTNVKYTALFTDTFATAHESAASMTTGRDGSAGGGGEFALLTTCHSRANIFTGFGVIRAHQRLDRVYAPIHSQQTFSLTPSR